MKATGLQNIRPIKDSVNAEDVPPWADIVEPHGRGFICRIREVPEWMKPTLPDKYKTVEEVGERESPTGNYTYPVLRKSWDVPELLWKLEPRPNGSATWNRNWQGSEEERAAETRRSQREKVLDMIGDRLAEADDPEAIVDRLLGERNLEPTPVAPGGEKPREPISTVEVAGMEAKMMRPGTWTLPDGSELQGKKADAEAALKELAGEE